MATYKIVGPFPVAGRNPGETVTDDDLSAYGGVAELLIEAGHITTTKASKATDKADQATDEQGA